MTPCPPPRLMANAAWRAWRAAHPLWHAPFIAIGCGAAVVAGARLLPPAPIVPHHIASNRSGSAPPGYAVPPLGLSAVGSEGQMGTGLTDGLLDTAGPAAGGSPAVFGGAMVEAGFGYGVWRGPHGPGVPAQPGGPAVPVVPDVPRQDMPEPGSVTVMIMGLVAAMLCARRVVSVEGKVL